LLAFTLLTSIFLLSCDSEKKISEEEIFVKRISEPENALEFLNSKLPVPVEYAVTGYFQNVDSLQICGVKEIISSKEWGIKFSLYNFTADTATLVYETPLLDGAVKEKNIKTIKIDSLGVQLLSYSSGDYFLGSGGGEVYFYLTDFSKQTIYYAHLILLRNKPVSLFLSPNIEDPAIKDYIINLFKTDYEDLVVVTKDIQLK
jgi:hypothetical protein